MKLQLGVIQCTSFHHLLRLQSGAKSQTPLRAKSSPPVPGKAVTPGLERRLHKGPGRLSSQSSLRDPTQVPTSVEIQVPGGAGGAAQPFCLVRPGTRGASGGGEGGSPSPSEQSQGTSESVSPSPGRGKHRHVCLFLNKCLQARRGQTPQRPGAAEVSAVRARSGGAAGGVRGWVGGRRPASAAAT